MFPLCFLSVQRCVPNLSVFYVLPPLLVLIIKYNILLDCCNPLYMSRFKAALCPAGCLHGGTCTAFNVCVCPPGYLGYRCEKVNGTYLGIQNLMLPLYLQTVTTRPRIEPGTPSMAPTT